MKTIFAMMAVLALMAGVAEARDCRNSLDQTACENSGDGPSSGREGNGGGNGR